MLWTVKAKITHKAVIIGNISMDSKPHVMHNIKLLRQDKYKIIPKVPYSEFEDFKIHMIWEQHRKYPWTYHGTSNTIGFIIGKGRKWNTWYLDLGESYKVWSFIENGPWDSRAQKYRYNQWREIADTEYCSDLLGQLRFFLSVSFNLKDFNKKLQDYGVRRGAFKMNCLGEQSSVEASYKMFRAYIRMFGDK